jgi:ribosome biogenesis GTPase / thiamine phosphate phosphatase
MAKRRLSHQQSRRIKNAQQAIDLDDKNNLQGLVISHRGGLVEIEAESDHQNIMCKLRSNLGDIVCGDRVVYQLDKGNPTIIAIRPRDNLLRRQDGFGHEKSVAANVTQLIICLAVEPEPNFFLLDQYLLSAEQQSINSVILLNKMDLLDHEDPDPFKLKAIYQPMGYPVLHSSIHNEKELLKLQQLCKDQVNVISGVSGVGKSSLTKAILPQIEIKIGEISEVNKEGKHTTRTSRLYHLPLGGDLIDTPGVRGFNPVIDKQKSISAGFREIHDLAANCQFNNCRHINEPKCSVLEALDLNIINPGRYENYVKLLQDLSD